MGLFLVKEITSKTGVLHFRRWRLFDSPWFGIYIHYIAKSDEDGHPHDHPWPFISFILGGGYIEELHSVRTDGSVTTQTFLNVPGDIRFRKAKGQFHKILSLLNPTWTLVIHGPKKPTWGYLTEDGWMDHQKYREEKRKGRWDEK